MRFTRLAPLALLVAIVSGGCRAGGGLSTFNSPSPGLSARPAQKASELLAEHNRNAERIKSFEAKTAITVRSGLFGGALDGGIVMERPRNFSLVLKSNAMGDVADIGSNDDEYWFWVRANDDKTKKAVYYCKHEDANTSEMAATLQPNWIIESLGFRVFPEAEMAEMTVKPGKQPGTLQITHHASTTSGISYTREIVLSESTHRIKELRILGEKMNPLAEAQILDDATQLSSSSPEASSSDELIYVPSHLKLKWTEGNLALDVRMKTPKVNFKMNDDRRQALFVEPERKGYERFNLASLADRSRGTTVRQTRPAPAPRVKLGEPTPVGADNARRTRNDPVALSADLTQPSSTAEEVVDVQLPSAPEPEFMKATARGWRSSRIPPIVRE